MLAVVPLVDVAISEPPIPGFSPLERWLFWVLILLVTGAVLWTYRRLSLKQFDHDARFDMVGKALVDRDARLLERWEKLDAALDHREAELEKKLVSRELFDERTNNQDRQLSWLLTIVQRIERKVGSISGQYSSPPPFPGPKGRGGKDT